MFPSRAAKLVLEVSQDLSRKRTNGHTSRLLTHPRKLRRSFGDVGGLRPLLSLGNFELHLIAFPDANETSGHLSAEGPEQVLHSVSQPFDTSPGDDERVRIAPIVLLLQGGVKLLQYRKAAIGAGLSVFVTG